MKEILALAAPFFCLFIIFCGHGPINTMIFFGVFILAIIGIVALLFIGAFLVAIFNAIFGKESSTEP